MHNMPKYTFFWLQALPTLILMEMYFFNLISHCSWAIPSQVSVPDTVQAQKGWALTHRMANTATTSLEIEE